jgi:hypothetical protein
VIASRFSFPLRLTALLALGLALLGPAPRLRADDQQPQSTPNLTEDTSDALVKLQPMLDAKQWRSALDLLQGLAAKVDPDSYDRALVCDTIAKVCMQIDKPGPAASNWEIALALADRHSNYFSPKDRMEIILSLAQTYYELGSATKDKSEQEAYLAKSTRYIKLWLTTTAKPTPEAQLFYTALLYTRATLDEKHPNLELIRQTEHEARIGLRMSLHPDEKFYQLLVACAQQESNMATAAEYFELLVWKHPKNKDYWQNLWLCYMNLASENEAKDPDIARDYYVRAINSLERAQKAGYMNLPKDNYNLFTLYYQVGQFGTATKLLRKGMEEYEKERADDVPADKRGGIESTVDNWEHLASAYQQNDQPAKAVDALKTAEKFFPEEGNLDLQMGEIYYYQLQNNAEAYRRFIDATSKKHLDKPFSAWVFAAYTAYNLEHYSDALFAVNKAEKFPEAAKDHQLRRLKSAVEEGLKLQQTTGQQPPTT